MDFSFPQNVATLIDRYSEFAASRLAGRGGHTDFDREAFQACADFGLLKLLDTSRSGDLPPGLLTVVGILEALGRSGADRGFLFAVGAHLFGCQHPLSVHGTSRRHTKSVADMALGRSLGALAITEPQGGTAIGRMQTRATPAGDGFVLNGCKTLITNAPEADVFLVIAATDPERGSFGWSAFLVERDTPGFTVERLPACGLMGAPLATIRFEDCEVDREALIGSVNGGLKVFNTAMLWERTGILAGFIGCADYDLERCIKFASARLGPNGPISAHQAISHRLARAKMRLERSRLLIQRAAWALDNKLANAHMTVAMAKLDASETLVETAMDVMRVRAGQGWVDEEGGATALIDSVGTLFASGTAEAQLNIIAAAIGLKRK